MYHICGLDIRLDGVPSEYSGALEYKDDFCSLVPIRGNNSWNADTTGLIVHIKNLKINICGEVDFRNKVINLRGDDLRRMVLRYLFQYFGDNPDEFDRFIRQVEKNGADKAQDELRENFRSLLGI